MPSPLPTIILTDSHGLEQNTDPAALMLAIEREDIESGNIARTLEKLLIISDTRENALLLPRVPCVPGVWLRPRSARAP